MTPPHDSDEKEFSHWTETSSRSSGSITIRRLSFHDIFIYNVGGTGYRGNSLSPLAASLVPNAHAKTAHPVNEADSLNKEVVFLCYELGTYYISNV